MKEIGGYIELDDFRGQEFYQDAVCLISGRACLEYLIRYRKIKKIYMPSFICDSIFEPCNALNVEKVLYEIDGHFNPVLPEKTDEDAYVYIVNYYGQLQSEDILRLKTQYKRIILDNAQAFFSPPPEGIDTIYVCRKFFGVADGAYLFTDAKCERSVRPDTSYGRSGFLFGRYESDAASFYSDYVANNEYFSGKGILGMSKLSRNFLRAIDYDIVRKKRTQNFACLHQRLKQINQLPLRPVEGAFAYPLLIENGRHIRTRLIQEKIYIPILWKDVFLRCENDRLSYQYSADILPLPVDQRYDENDMNYIARRILRLLS